MSQIKKSCWGSEENSAGSVENIVYCKKCEEKAQKVDKEIVRHFVINSLKKSIIDGDYYLCLNEECRTTYFNKENTIILKNSDLNTQIGFKKDSYPKYICYCNKVTEQQIIDAVVNNNARSIKDVVIITGAMKNSNCKINNPLGKCCSSDIQKIINNILVSK